MESTGAKFWRRIGEEISQSPAEVLWSLKRERQHKWIISVADAEAAEIIREGLLSVVAEPEFRRHVSGEEKPYRLQVKVVSCTGPIHLTLMPAKRVVQMEAGEARETILDERDRVLLRLSVGQDSGETGEVSSEYAGEISKIDGFISDHGSACPVTGVFEMGSSYRITFFDAGANRRRQESVGDVVIAVGGSHVEGGTLQRAPRSDRKTRQNEDVIACAPLSPFYCRTRAE